MMVIYEVLYRIRELLELLIPFLIPLLSIVIIVLAFLRLREKIVAVRWLFSLGLV
jgi:hypothetical protein